MNPLSLPDSTVLFDDQRYTVEVTLINSHATIPIPNGVITELIIEDNLYSIFYSARMIINSSENMLDSFTGGGQNELKEFTNPQSYAFNTDNRDHIEIRIIPVTAQGEDEQVFPANIFGMQYLFYIYDEEEIINKGADTNKKSKVFYLKDCRAQTLEETKMQWSTTKPLKQNVKGNINISHVGNRHRQVRTGDAIATLLQDALPTHLPHSFNPDWDHGATEVFYTSSPQTNAFDDLEYLLDRHISAKNEDNCILSYGRNGAWSLRSYNSLFEAAVDKRDTTFGPTVTDIFNIHGGGSNAPKPDASKISPSNPFGVGTKEAQQLEGLTSFNFLNVPGESYMKDVASTFVHSYNSGEKQFNIDCKDTYIQAAREKFQKLYADPMVGDNPVAIFPTNIEQRNNTICNHIFSHGIYRAERVKAGVNRILNKALAYSPGVSFSVKGSTHRMAGDFTVLASNNISLDTAYGRILQGEWLMTSIIHTFAFEGQKYMNNITCTKPHASMPLTPAAKSSMLAQRGGGSGR